MPYKDKLEHCAFSFLLTVSIYWFTRLLLLTVVVVLLTGLLKECVDQWRGKNTIAQSAADLIADSVGIALGVMIVGYLLRSVFVG